MTSDSFRYDRRIRSALLGVMRDVLAQVASSGLPSEHRLYITFDCSHPAVSMSQRLRKQHAESEMTIVLQHQFWDLNVARDCFAVSLNFSGEKESLVIPFDAVKRFIDPSANFGLEFAEDEEHPDDRQTTPTQNPIGDEDAMNVAPLSNPKSEKIIKLDAFRKKLPPGT